MDFGMGWAKPVRLATIESLAKATAVLAQQPVPRVALHSLAEKPRQAQMSPAPVVRWDLLAPAFASPNRQPSTPWRVVSGCEQRLWFCRSSHRSSTPCRPRRVTSLNFRRVFLPSFVRNRFHAASVRQLQARSRQKAQRGARFRTTPTMALERGQLDEVILRQPYQFTRFKDSMRRGSRTGKREVRGTIRR
jgi:hypothetical protein